MNLRLTDTKIVNDINCAGVKVCKNCEVEYPATEKYFYRAKGNKDGFRCECKRCTDKAQYQKKVKDLILEMVFHVAHIHHLPSAHHVPRENG